MKNIILFLSFCIALMTTSVASAQSHRHTPRTNVSSSAGSASQSGSTLEDETAVELYSDTTSTTEVDTLSYGYGSSNIHTPFDDMDDFANKVISSGLSEGIGWMTFGLTFIVFFFIFGLPALLILALIIFLYKRNKQRDAVYKAAIDKGVEIPNSYRQTTSVADEDSMRKGIKRIAVGLGLVVLGYYTIDLLCAIGWMIAIFGVGQLAIAKFVDGKKKTDDADFITYEQQQRNNVNSDHTDDYEKFE